MGKFLKLIKKIIIEMKIIIETTDQDLDQVSDVFGRRYNLDSKMLSKVYKNNNK